MVLYRGNYRRSLELNRNSRYCGDGRFRERCNAKWQLPCHHIQTPTQDDKKLVILVAVMQTEDAPQFARFDRVFCASKSSRSSQPEPSEIISQLLNEKTFLQMIFNTCQSALCCRRASSDQMMGRTASQSGQSLIPGHLLYGSSALLAYMGSQKGGVNV